MEIMKHIFIFFIVIFSGELLAQCPAAAPSATHASGCPGTYTLKATSVNGSVTAHKWYTTAGGSTVVSTTQSSPTSGVWLSQLTTNFPATVTYYVAAVCGGSESARTPVTFTATASSTITITPSGSTMGICHGSVFTLTASNGSNYAWRLGSATNPVESYANPYSPTQAGTYYLTGQNSCGTQQSTSIPIAFNPKPTQPTISAPSVIASGSSANFTAGGATGGESYHWYNAGVNLVGTGSSYVTSLLTQNTTYHLAKFNTTTNCESDKVIVPLIANQLPVIQVADQSVILPVVSVALNATITDPDGTISSITWTKTSGPTGISLSGATTNILTLTNISAGVYVFRLSVMDNNSFYTHKNVTLSVSYSNYVTEETINTKGVNDPANITSLSVDNKNMSASYFDGLGNSIQQIAWQGSPLKKDVVQPIEYDNFGRESIQYLPYVSTANDGQYKAGVTSNSGVYAGSVHANFYANPSTKISNDLAPYSATSFEPSPLNRVNKQGAAGVPWQPDAINSIVSNDKTVKKSYELNGEKEVLLFDYVIPTTTYPMGLIKPGKFSYYPANELFKSRTRDEDGNEMIEFTNKFGQVILKKVQVVGSSYAQTYYTYNEAGKLICVLQPEAIPGILSNLPMTWANMSGVSFANSILTKTAASGYTTGSATSTIATETLAASTDGWVEMTANEINKSRMIGLSSTNLSGTNIQFAIELRNDGKIYVWESGVAVGATLGNYVTKTVVRVSREGSQIKYYVNGKCLRTSAGSSTGTLIVDAALNEVGSTIQDAVISFKVNSSMPQLLNNFAFLYTYDVRKRMSQKQVPGAKPVYMVYDNRDRLALTQDGNQRTDASGSITKKEWTFTKYDAFNRPVLTGILTADSILVQSKMQLRVNAFYAAVPNNGGAWFETYTGAATIHGYDNKSFPQETNDNNYLTVNYYDNYAFRANWLGSYTYVTDNLSAPSLTGTYTQVATGSQNQSVVGQVTGFKVKVLDGGVAGGYTWLKSLNYFDDKYRVIQIQADNYKGGIDRISNVYDFVGKVLKSKTTHTESDIAWKDVVSLKQEGNKLTSVAGPAQWGYGASSVQQLAAGQDGWFEVMVTETNTTKMIGFNDSNSGGTSNSDINYAFQLYNTTLYVQENASNKATVTGLNPGDILRMERIGTTITFKRNGLPITTTAITPSSTALFIDNSFHIAGNTIAGVRSSFSTTSKSITRTFEYDHAGRLTNTWHQIDTGTPYLLSRNEYNELGQLVDKKLHSTLTNASDNKQSVDYRYNIRGWLTSMNNASLTADATNDEVTDYFGMNLSYNTVDTDLINAALYNGNITGMKWSNYPGTGTTKQKGYVYTYDAMNRIKSSIFKEKTTSWAAAANSGFGETGYTYDFNGNLKTMQRNDKRGTGWMDNLFYNYGTGANQSNKLLKVEDTGDDFAGFMDGNPSLYTDFTTATDDYRYDANGNMMNDRNKGIGTSITDNVNVITYNYLNLPEIITKGGNSVRYIYDAGGRKLSQVVTTGTSQKQTDYVGEFTYENDVLQFISHEEGRVMMSSNKLMAADHGESVTSMTAYNTASLALITQNGTEKYVKITATGITPRSGAFPIGTSYTVAGGERYRVRVKGYRTGTKDAYLLIKTNLGDLNWPGSKLPSAVASESWVEQIVTIPTGATTLQAGLVWDVPVNAEIMYLNEFEITKLGTTSPEYQYNLKDHLGNVRVTFTTIPEIDCGTATLEAANAATERSQFVRYENARIVNHYLFDRTNGVAPTTTPGGAQRLAGGTNEKYGLARSLSVMPGDVINMEVYGKYIDSNTANLTTALSTLVSQIAAGTAPGGTVIDGGTYGSSTSSFPFAGGLNGTTGSSGTGPKAYLNWLVFDRNYVLIPGKSGYMRMTTAAREYGQDVAHERLYGSVTVDQPGYIYVYLSNEEVTNPYEVYFDAFNVCNVKSPVIQTDDYHPFGLTYNSYQRENSIENKKLYNGKEIQTALNISWFDYGWRSYDPQIGRWNQVDPFVDKYEDLSPYNYVRNNPIVHTDPDGRWINIVVGAIVGAAVEYGTQVAGNYMDGKTGADAWIPSNGSAIVVSGIAGGLTSGTSALGGKFTNEAIKTGISTAESVAKQATTGDGKVTLSKTVTDVIGDKIGDVGTKKLQNVLSLPSQSQMTRAQSMSGPNAKASRQADLAKLTKETNIKTTVNQVVREGSSNTASNVAQVATETVTTKPTSLDLMTNTIKPDATRTVTPGLKLIPQ